MIDVYFRTTVSWEKCFGKKLKAEKTDKLRHWYITYFCCKHHKDGYISQTWVDFLRNEKYLFLISMLLSSFFECEEF